MIEGMLGELAPEVEVTEAQATIEEGSSSTLDKKDNEDDNTIKDDRFINAPSHQIEIQKGLLRSRRVCQREV